MSDSENGGSGIVKSHLFGAMLSRDETFDAIVRQGQVLGCEWAQEVMERIGSSRKSHESLSFDDSVSELGDSAATGEKIYCT